jgi:hypothetical protein
MSGDFPDAKAAKIRYHQSNTAEPTQTPPAAPRSFPALDSQASLFMNMSNYSKYQQKVIKNFYNNRDSIALQRVQELVTELYLAEGKKLEKHWQSLASHLQKLDVKQPTIDHLLEQRNPELVANLVKSLMTK